MRIITLKVEGIEKGDTYERDFEVRSLAGVPTLFCTRCGREIKNDVCEYDEYGHKDYRIIDEDKEEKMFDDRVGIIITNVNEIEDIEKKEGVITDFTDFPAQPYGRNQIRILKPQIKHGF